MINKPNYNPGPAQESIPRHACQLISFALAQLVTVRRRLSAAGDSDGSDGKGSSVETPPEPGALESVGKF